MTKREYCEYLNKLQAEAIELQAMNRECGDFDEKLEDAICGIRAAIEALIPDEELHKSEPQRPQRWPEYETPSFKESVNASVCPMCGGSLDKDEKRSQLVCHRCRVYF